MSQSSNTSSFAARDRARQHRTGAAPESRTSGAMRHWRCGQVWAGVVLVIVIRGGEASAADQLLLGDQIAPPAKRSPDALAARGALRYGADLTLQSPFALPRSYQFWETPGLKATVPRDFGPRPSAVSVAASSAGERDQPLMSNNSVWQRLAECRTKGNVRILTLWETGGSNLSLLAGHRGNPTLQWTSGLSSRRAAAPGVLDEFVTSAIVGFGRGPHNVPHAYGGDFPGKSKPFDPLPAGLPQPR